VIVIGYTNSFSNVYNVHVVYLDRKSVKMVENDMIWFWKNNGVLLQRDVTVSKL